MDPKFVAPLLTTALVLWVVYRRIRRNIGRQPVQPGRMKFRIGMLGVVGALISMGVVQEGPLIGAMLAGVAGGAGLGWIGLRETKFEAIGRDAFYTPHLYIGLFVSGLLLARLAYRFLAVYPSIHAAVQADQNPFGAYQKSPLTLAVFGVVIGYYVFYYAGVLRRSRDLAAVGSRRPDER
ncbi:MAG: DUF1453 domain-containing protein [Proteobacteria bacterium]|nr:DUF1453 domain-containing protein [Pseudomonadota bacterium]